MIRKSVYLLLFLLICFSFVKCKSKTREEMIRLQIQAVDDKLISNEYRININQFVTREGIVYKADKESFIKINDRSIQVQLPDIKDSIQQTFMTSCPLTDYNLQKKDKGVSLISATFETSANKTYNLSILVTQFGDATVYMNEGFYYSISFVGELE